MQENSNPIKAFDAEEENKKFYKEYNELVKRMAINGTAMVQKEAGQWTLDLGVEQKIDELIPPTKEEIEWMAKP